MCKIVFFQDYFSSRLCFIKIMWNCLRRLYKLHGTIKSLFLKIYEYVCSSFKLTNFKWRLTLFDEKDENSATHKRKD